MTEKSAIQALREDPRMSVTTLLADIHRDLRASDEEFDRDMKAAIERRSQRTNLIAAELNRAIGLVEKAGGDSAELRVDRALAKVATRHHLPRFHNGGRIA